MRDVVEQRLSEQAGAGLYLRVANAIEGLGVAAAHTAQLVHLLSAAALFDNSVRERAVDWNRRAAAHAAQVLAFEHAVGFYQRALALMPDGDVGAQI